MQLFLRKNKSANRLRGRVFAGAANIATRGRSTRFNKQQGSVHVLILVIVLVLIGVIVFFSFHQVASEQNNGSESVVVASIPLSDIPVVKKRPTRMVFLGDMIFDRGVETSVKNNFDGDWSRLFENLDFPESDILFANLEGPVSDVGRNVGSKWSFRMNPAVLPVLHDVGFDIVSFANNHVGDWSQAAFEDTLKRLEDNTILYAGAGWNYDDATTPTIIEKDGVTFGFLGFTDVGPNWMAAKSNTAGILLASDANFSQIVRDAKETVDVLIVSVHWGEEYIPHNSRQTTIAHRAVDAGADLVIGHHPHVIQDIEWYNDKLIAYSLGNFIFDQYFANETMQGLALTVEFDGAEVASVEREIIELDSRYQPQAPRKFESTDVVHSRIATTSLCPTVGGYTDRWLFNVNHDNSLDQYQPPRVTHMNNRIDARGTMTCLTPATADALESMINDARDAGLKIVMTSGYRPYATQKILYENSSSSNEDTLYPSVAKPGHSEHQLGTTVDLKSLSTTEFSYAAFGASPEYEWMVENAHKYGFVQSYPAGSEPKTGYIAEPWHWRYVGTKNATNVKNSGLLLTEFLSQSAL